MAMAMAMAMACTIARLARWTSELCTAVPVCAVLLLSGAQSDVLSR